MKKIIFLSALFAAFFCLSAAAEEVDAIWIVEGAVDTADSLVRVDHPDFSPGDAMFLYVAVDGLAVRWGEGQAKWKYYYQSSNGKVIWSSPFTPVTRQFADSQWKFSEIVTITLPESIPSGRYGLGFMLVDAHSMKEYQGWTDFTVDMESVSRPHAKDGVPEPSGLTGTIGGIELSLVSVRKETGRLLLDFSGLNGGDAERLLSLYPYGSRIIDSGGNEYVFSEVGGGGGLSDGTVFPPGERIAADLHFDRPAGEAEGIALLYLSFYDTEDVLEVRSLPVPWP